MQVKSIELNAFKSFGKKSTILFTTPLTAIVGPNGSGKSNIVESIRFVLGEQSMKSLRGKGGVDLIFKGSKTMSAANRASVTITFDNSKKVFSFTNSGLGVPLDYDEVSITREVYADGANKYSINNTEVRLKDVVDLLASVNIGSSGHHIISQGEADRVLNSSSKDRRNMIEDALGLKVYQFRIKESERKLEKTLINIKEVASLRREIAPHIGFLKKQVEKIEKAHALRDELKDLYKNYLSSEASYIAVETKRLTHARRILDESILSFDERIATLPASGEKSAPNHQSEISALHQEMGRIRGTSAELSRTLGRIEGMIENARSQMEPKEKSARIINEQEWNSLLSLCESEIDNALSANDLGASAEILKSLKIKLKEFRNETKDTDHNTVNAEKENHAKELMGQHENILADLENINKQEVSMQNEIRRLEEEDRASAFSVRDSEHARYELLQNRNQAQSELHSLRFEDEKLVQIKNVFDTELQEGAIIIGRESIIYSEQLNENTETVDRNSQEETRRKIERIKIKLEDAGAGNSSEILKEYNDTVERDQFLARELEDLNTSIVSLRDLIVELKDTLDSEFKKGVEKINKQFQEFFSLMFGGGSALLSITMEHKKPKKIGEEDEEGEGEVDENAELTFERGVDINVSLPQKKVKDLNMLSGGERSLTSIALLFAMSQVNPPPFLVLDETDAALDEANSRKYGNMLENLSKYSELIVVTHNRETMSRAQVLYGVTMDSSGASKLLSIRLEDANAYAK